MRREQLVPTRETCERMKAAGFDQRTHFGWYEPEAPPTWLDAQGEGPLPPYLHEIGHAGQVGLLCAAPTFAEIAEELPSVSLARIDGPEWHAQTLVGDHEADANAAEAAALLWLALNPAKEEERP